MHSLSRVSILRSIKKSSILSRKNFCALNTDLSKSNNFESFLKVKKFYFLVIYLLKSNETVNKLIQKDYNHFDRLSQEKGRHHVMVELDIVNQNLDLSTKLGKDIFEYSKEMTQKIVLHERTIEE